MFGRGVGLWWLIVLASSFLSGETLVAGIHRAPIIIPGFKIKAMTRYPLDLYRLYRTGPRGEAVPIPFQIDEVNQFGDYVLDQGPAPNRTTGNHLFDLQDELSFMGDDVGPIGPPTVWPTPKPSILFELRFSRRSTGEMSGGAVFVGIHINEAPPPLVDQKYVVFNLEQGTVLSSRYRYEFDKRNYLVVNGVGMVKAPVPPQLVSESLRVIDSSTFFMKADLKYFVTFLANHRSVDSKLEAFKTGPVRTIVRVTFIYSVLKLNFELGMYTEVSFFTNSVILPAIMYNPIDGRQTLNNGSGFYYGFTLHDNPASLDIQTNIQPFQEKKGLLDRFKSVTGLESKYWVTMVGSDRMMFVEIVPSPTMLADQNIPYFYRKDQSGPELSAVDNSEPRDLSSSRVNLGLYFDLTKFRKGEHIMSFKLFFENKRDLAELESFKTLGDWYYRVSRI